MNSSRRGGAAREAVDDQLVMSHRCPSSSPYQSQRASIPGARARSRSGSARCRSGCSDRPASRGGRCRRGIGVAPRGRRAPICAACLLAEHVTAADRAACMRFRMSITHSLPLGLRLLRRDDVVLGTVRPPCHQSSPQVPQRRVAIRSVVLLRPLAPACSLHSRSTPLIREGRRGAGRWRCRSSGTSSLTPCR